MINVKCIHQIVDLYLSNCKVHDILYLCYRGLESYFECQHNHDNKIFIYNIYNINLKVSVPLWDISLDK